MALGTTLKLGFREDGQMVVPVSGTSRWQTVIDAGGPASQDNSGTVTNPDSHITASTRHIFRRERGQGTTLRLRFGYSNAATISANPIHKVFGRTSVLNADGSVASSDAWQLLRTKGGNLTTTLTTASTDADDGTYKYTSPHNEEAAFDCEGCNEFIIGTTTAAAASGGSVATSFTQAKFL